MRVPRLAALSSGGLLVAGLSIGLAGTAHASDPTVPAATWNEIYIPFDNIAGNRLSNMCMAAAHMGDNNNTPLVATTCQPFTDLSQVLELA